MVVAGDVLLPLIVACVTGNRIVAAALQSLVKTWLKGMNGICRLYRKWLLFLTLVFFSSSTFHFLLGVAVTGQKC